MSVPILKIYGPPGCGKTTSALSLIRRIQETGRTVAFSSFTRKARDEAKSRLGDNLKKVKVKTLHSFAFGVMNYEKHFVLSNRQKFAEWIGEEITDDQLENLNEDINMDTPVTKLDIILRLHDTERNLCRPLEPSEFPLGVNPSEYHATRDLYISYKNREFFVDFTDMMSNAIEQDLAIDSDVFFVDEAQDLTPLQWQAVFTLGQNCEQIVALGDDDQAIYGWMGGDPYTFLHTPAEQSVVLGKSFRVTAPIHRYSQSILKRMEQRHEKVFSPTERPGKIFASHELDYDSDIRPYRSCVILYRNHHLAKDIRSYLKSEGIPYRGQYSPFDRRSELEAIQTWERWRRGIPTTVRDALRAQRYILGPYRLPCLEALPPDDRAPTCPSKKPWYDVLRVQFKESYEIVQQRHGIGELFKTPTLELSSIHHAKGGEWDKVILMTDMTKATYDAMNNGGAEIEHRVWYVAITRAIKELQILAPRTAMHYPLENI